MTSTLILAGPGTGKTFTIVETIKDLIQSGKAKPEEVLALTFSVEAANSLKERVAKAIGNTEQVNVRTFHSFCADILRTEGSRIGVDPAFSILQPEETKVFFYKYLDTSAYEAELYSATISTAKDLSITYQEIKDFVKNLRSALGENADKISEAMDIELKTLHLRPADTVEQRRAIKEEKERISDFLDRYEQCKTYEDMLEKWQSYQELKKEKNLMDFSDLNMHALEVINKFSYKSRYRYLIVDEFQDTNKAQFDLIKNLGIENITVVGDRNQSIYGFRGAYTENVTHFIEDFKAKKKELKKSHRSPNSVLRASHSLIINNYEDPKDCFEISNVNEIEGEPVKVIELRNEASEAAHIAEIAEAEIDAGTAPEQICVLYRTHKQGVSIRQAFESKCIPVTCAGSIDIFKRPETKTVVSYLGIISNLRHRSGTGEQAWWNLFHYKNDLSPEDSVRIGRALTDDSIDNLLLNNISSLGLSPHGQEVITRVVTKLKELVKSTGKPLPELVMDIYEIVGLNRMFSHKRTPENIESLLNLKEFYEIAKSYTELHGEDLKGFIEYIEILEKVGAEKASQRIIPVKAVRLMTIHAVKGLEFETVIMSNMANGRFPVTRTFKEPLIPKELIPYIRKHLEKNPDADISEIEKDMLLLEERRLCYVGMTRAKKKLILTYAKSYGSKENVSPSTFLDEIQGNYIFEKIEEEKGVVIAPDSKYERRKSELKQQLMESLDSESFSDIVKRVASYHSMRVGEIPDYRKMLSSIEIDNDQLSLNLQISRQGISCLQCEDIRFSVSSLESYDECPKRYELEHIFHMPERGDFEGGDAKDYGTFLHKVLEEGVRQKFSSKEQFIELAVGLSKHPDFRDIEPEEVLPMIEVFWQRNKGRYDDSEVEKYFRIQIDGLTFSGKIDRIDDLGDGEVEVIDYKSNTHDIPVKKRAWQLSMYAKALKELGRKPRKLTLEMLKMEKPYTYDLDDDMNARSGRMKGFNVDDCMKDMIETAKKIIYDYEHEFKPAEDADACKWCGYKFYCERWGE